MIATKALMWLVTVAMTGRIGGFAMMAADGYDFDGPFLPAPGSVAEVGLGLALIGDGAVVALAAMVWIVMSSTVVAVRNSLPVTDWGHGSGAVWGWWLVPGAWLWMPRRVYLEILGKAWPSHADDMAPVVRRWWLSLLLWLATLVLVLVPGGPIWHVVLSGIGVALAAAATVGASEVLDFLARPETQSVGPANSHQAPDGPTTPGWYNDPSGRATHQAWWDGTRWTGATRPGPGEFPDAG